MGACQRWLGGHDDAAWPLGLALVEGGIYVGKQAWDVSGLYLRSSRRDDEADARRDVPGDDGDDPSSDCLGSSLVAVVQNGEELVSTMRPARRLGEVLPTAGPRAAGCPGSVSKRIIECLEPVEVDIEHRHRKPTTAPRPRARRLCSVRCRERRLGRPVNSPVKVRVRNLAASIPTPALVAKMVPALDTT